MTVDVVTGGAGFIGSHVTDRLLAEGRRVRVIDNLSTGTPDNLAHIADGGRLELCEIDIAETGALGGLFGDAERVFHLAALADIVPSIQKPEAYFRANVDGTFHVMQEARRAGVSRLVYAASSSCYGIPDSYPTGEKAEIRPQYPYALTKYLGECIVTHWSQVYDVPAISLRMFNVYGPRARTTGTYGAVFGVFMAQLLAGEPLTIVGDGTQTRDFTFVADVADAFVTAANSASSGQIYNVGSGSTYSVNRLVELLAPEKTVHIPKRPGEPDCTWADVSRIAQELGWHAKTSFEDGVAIMRDHIEHWREAPVWTPETIDEATRDWFRYLGASPGLGPR